MVILCGGLATRLGDLAKNTPKSMINIHGKPFLWYQIENLKKHNIRDIVLCVGHLSEKIIEYFGDGTEHDVNITYSHDGDKPLGPIGALKKAEPLLDNIFFIMYGDSYLNVDFQEVHSFFKKHNKLGCMVVYKNKNKYDKSNLVIKNNMVIDYNKEQSKDMIYIDYGTSILRKKTLETIPPNTFYTTGEFFSKLIKQKQLLAYEAKKRFYHIGTPEALREFKKYIKTLK